jgi:gliding motility-associated-like protein
MKNRSKLILNKITITFLFMFLEIAGAMAQGRFIENKGQWLNDIVSRAEIKSGAIFLCKNQIRYNFIDHRDLEILHSDPYIDSFSIHQQSFFIDWLNANLAVTITSVNEYPEYYNYFIGNDPKRWKSRVHAYSTVNYTNLYPGINLTVDASGDMLEYTYVISPGTSVSSLKMKVEGAEGVLLANGDLKIYSPMISITEQSPFAYQWIEGKKTPVSCKFDISNENIVSFILPEGYDQTKPLIIDPVVIFATYSGSKADNFGFTGTYDVKGDGYSGGDVYGIGFPVTAGAYQTTWKGGNTYSSNPANPNYINLQVYGFTARDVGILKYTPDGKNLLYATYLGGTKGNEQPHSMVVDKSDNLVVIGTTASSDFPVTSGSYNTLFGGKTDIFVSKLSPDGTKLLASTFMGGSGFDGLNGVDTFHYDTVGFNVYIVPDAGTKLCYNYGDQFRGEVITDNVNSVYVASSTLSTNFPTTAGSLQPKFGGGKQDGIVFKLDSTLSKLVWSTYMGGTQDDGAYSLQLDSSSNVFVTGGTLSPYFFPSGKSFQNYLAGNVDGYICHLKNDGSGIIRATYFGTVKYDQNYFLQLDRNENVYVYGQTESTGFPVRNVKYAVFNSGNYITKFNNGLDSIMFSSVFGSGKRVPDVSPTAFLVDKCEKIYISGWGGELFYPSLSRLRKVYDMPVSKDAFQSKTIDSSDFYVSVFERNMDTLLYASYFGGALSEEHVDGGTSRFDKNGIMYQSVCGGCGGNSDFPTTPGAWSRINKSDNCNNLLFKVDLKLTSLKAGFIAPKSGCRDVTFKFTNTSTKAKSYLWNFGDSTTSTADSPSHFYESPGIYNVTLIAIDPNSCEVRDTFKSTITVYKTAKAAFSVNKDSCGLTVKYIQTGISSSTSWSFGDGTYSNSYNGRHSYPAPGKYKVKLLVDSGTACADSFTQVVTVTGLRADFSYDFHPCQQHVLQFTNLSIGVLKSRKWYFPFASTDTSKNPQFDFTAPGTYQVSLAEHDSFGCKDSITKTIIITSSTHADFKVSVDSCNRKAFFTNKSTGSKSVQWLFGDGATSSGTDTVSHIYEKDTSYKVTLIADPQYPCADTVVKTITFEHPKAQFTFSIDSCSGTVHFINSSVKAVSSFWNFTNKDTSSLKDPVFTYPVKGHYLVKLTVTSSAGCFDSVTNYVQIDRDVNHKLFIPNVFTPNGDGYNKKFVVEGLSSCYNYDMDIYNRWGQLMYRASGTQLIWDGYYNGKLVPEGVYYFVFHGPKEGELKGSITVIY